MPEFFDNDTLDKKNVSHELEIDNDPLVHEEVLDKKQERKHRKKAFKYAIQLIEFFLILFLILLVIGIVCPEIRSAVLKEPHLMTLPIILLIIPSTIFWGIVKGVYRVRKEEMLDIMKTLPTVSSLLKH